MTPTSSDCISYQDQRNKDANDSWAKKHPSRPSELRKEELPDADNQQIDSYKQFDRYSDRHPLVHAIHAIAHLLGSSLPFYCLLSTVSTLP